VRITRDQPFELVFMDVQMPVMDGIDATRAIRQRERLSGGELKIIAMTANAMHSDRERCLQAGMDGYLSKPIDAARLIGEIERVLGGPLLLKSASPAQAPDPDAGEDLPDIDMADVLARLEGDHELLAELVDMARLELPELIAALRKAAAQHDHPALQRKAHALAGMAGNLSAVALMTLGRKLEATADTGQWDEIERLIERVVERAEAFSQGFPGQTQP
jgi:CheY-like chemotaxis protein